MTQRPNTIPCPRAYAEDRPCGEMTPDGLLCAKCTSRLRYTLNHLPAAYKDLDVTLTRQSKTGEPGKRGRETPIVFDQVASLTGTDVAHTLIVWIGAVAERAGEDLDRRDLICHGHSCVTVITWAPGRTLREWCGWLLQRMGRIRSHPEVAEMYDELTYALKIALRAVDRPADVEFAGRCDLCGSDIYARPGTEIAGEEVACRRCVEVVGPDGYVPYYDVADRRSWMRSQYRESLAPAPEIMLVSPSMFGVEINANTFRSWVNRGLLVASGNGPAGPLYSVDRVLTLATQAADRSTKRVANKGIRSRSA